MVQLIKQNRLSLILGLVVIFAALVLLAPTTFAAQSDISKQVCEGVTSAAGGNCDPAASSGSVAATVETLINVLSWAIGVIAVFMIIYGGFRFVTSTGDSAKLTAARQTIIYALVGIVVVVLAQTIVKFVIGQFT